MRRWIAVLASAALVASSLTVRAAAAPTASSVEVTAARIVAQGVAVDVTFKIRCKDFDNRVFISGNLKQGVRKQNATGSLDISDGDGSAIECRYSMTTRVFAEDWAFRRGAATVTAIIASCGPHDDECEKPIVKSLMVQLTRARQASPLSIASAPGVLGAKLLSAKLAAKGRAVDLRFKVTGKEIGRDSRATFVYGIDVSQAVRGRVLRASIGTQYTEALPNPHTVTLRISRPQGVRTFKARDAFISIHLESYSESYGEPCCFEADMRGALRVLK